MKATTINKIFHSLFVLLLFVGIANAQDIQKGVRMYETDQFSAAKQYFLDLAGANQKNAEVMYYVGEFYLKMGNKDSAKIFFENAIKIDDDNMYSLVGSGVIALMNDEQEKAKKQFKEAISNTPKKTILSYLRIADCYLALGLTANDDAIEYLNKARDIDRKNPRLYDIMAGIYFARNDGSKAIENFQKAVDFDRSYVMGHVGKGRVYNRTRNLGAAESAFVDANNADLTHSIPYKELAELYYGQRKYEKAITNLKKYIELSEETVPVKTQLVRYLYLNKNYAEAVEVCDKILSNQPDANEIVQLKAYAYYSMEDYTNAAKTFETYFAKADQSKLSRIDYEYYAVSLNKSGKEMESIPFYLKAQELDTTSFDMYGTVGDIYFKNNKWIDAIESYKMKGAKSDKGLSMKENYNLAFAYYRNGNLELADVTFGAVIEKNPELALAHFWRARSNSQIDSTLETGAAKPHYEKFVELTAGQVDKYKNQIIEAYTYLGAYYIAKKDVPEFKSTWKDSSKVYWNKILEIDPGNKQAEEVLKSIK
ncbi:MAG: tetratricopeptide repeat protein [Ignavibacteriaceae bacterium]|nr:tetratricopeptide repeat protein [Ignavibacteriaceae bacterium]